MKENPLRKNNNELEEILKQYENLKKGRSHSYIDEDSFEEGTLTFCHGWLINELFP